jgi:hypothetical protein
VQIVNDAQGADDMSDHDEWISYSQWGMFTPGKKSSNWPSNIAEWTVVNPHAA